MNGDRLPTPQSSPVLSTTANVVRVAILFEGSLILIASALGWLLATPPWAAVQWSPAALGWGLVAAVPPLCCLVLIMRWPIGPLRALRQLCDEFLTPLFVGATLPQLLLISLLAGWGEELLFRGVLQAWVGAQLSHPLAGAVIASLLFGAAHWLSTTYFVLATLIGAYLAWLWWITGDLLTPITTHAAYDFAALLYLLRRTPDPWDASAENPTVRDPPQTQSG